MSSQSMHGNLSMVIVKPKRSWVWVVGIVGEHKESSKPPNNCDDRIDDEEPSDQVSAMIPLGG